MKITRLVVLAASCLVASANAQINLKYYPSHPNKDKTIPQSCIDAGEVMLKEAKKFPVPAKWDVYIPCDDLAWMDVMNKIHHQTGLGVYGDTDPNASLTFFRGLTLLGKTGKDAPTPEHLVAHELAHIFLHSYKEDLVDTLAMKWMKERSAHE